MEVLIGFAINIDPYEDYETNHFLPLFLCLPLHLLAIRGVAFPIPLRIAMENCDLARDNIQKGTGNRGILVF